MIVNYTESGWQIITQRSHGLLAGQICAQWKKDQQPERWVETLIRYESRTIEQLSFKNVNEFRKAFMSAEIVSHELVISAG